MISGPFTDIFKQDYTSLGEPGSHLAVSYSWGVNEHDEREILRVTIINEAGQLVFDSIIQPTKSIKHVPLYNMYLFDPSFGIPLKYLSIVLSQIFEKRIIIGFQMNKLLEMLNLQSVYQTRDIMVHPDIGANQTPSNIAKTFFDLRLDPYFRSTITEARLFMAIYKNF